MNSCLRKNSLDVLLVSSLFLSLFFSRKHLNYLHRNPWKVACRHCFPKLYLCIAECFHPAGTWRCHDVILTMMQQNGVAAKLVTLPYIHHLYAYEPQHNKTKKEACVPSEDSDQPSHPPILIIVVAMCVKGSWGSRFTPCAQRRH